MCYQMRRALFYVIFGLLACLGASAQSVGKVVPAEADTLQADSLGADSIEISLLTCSPGTKVYSLYGHTALRVKDRPRQLDLVFNYGVFDFRTPHFTWRFILGECDYIVQGYSFDLFLMDYLARGSSVMEQVLDLTPAEAMALYRSLMVNALPENRTYRYNFLTNNCTTKARDMVERAVAGRVVYEEAPEHPTYRQLLHAYTHDYPWSEQGNDILLGADCDTVLSDRAAQFLPEQLMQYFETAQIYDEQNNRRPLLRQTRVLLQKNEQRLAAQKPAVPLDGRLTPLAVGWGLLAVVLIIGLVEYRTRRMWWGLDLLLMTLQGVAGLLLCFMFFFSLHPTMDSNWQVLVFNPLPLLCMPWVVKCAVRGRACPYHYVNMLWLTLFVAFLPWIPQDFSAMTLPLALLLLSRPISYYLHYNRS